MAGTRNFVENDLVWAKMKGSPHWPARVDKPPPGEKSKNKLAGNWLYVFFYGTLQYGWVAKSDLLPYEEYKEKFSKPCSRRGFNEGVSQIEKDPHLTVPSVKTPPKGGKKSATLQSGAEESSPALETPRKKRPSPEATGSTPDSKRRITRSAKSGAGEGGLEESAVLEDPLPANSKRGRGKGTTPSSGGKGGKSQQVSDGSIDNTGGVESSDIGSAKVAEKSVESTETPSRASRRSATSKTQEQEKSPVQEQKPPASPPPSAARKRTKKAKSLSFVDSSKESDTVQHLPIFISSRTRSSARSVTTSTPAEGAVKTTKPTETSTAAKKAVKRATPAKKAAAGTSAPAKKGRPRKQKTSPEPETGELNVSIPRPSPVVGAMSHAVSGIVGKQDTAAEKDVSSEIVEKSYKPCAMSAVSAPGLVGETVQATEEPTSGFDVGVVKAGEGSYTEGDTFPGSAPVQEHMEAPEKSHNLDLSTTTPAAVSATDLEMFCHSETGVLRESATCDSKVVATEYPPPLANLVVGNQQALPQPTMAEFGECISTGPNIPVTPSSLVQMDDLPGSAVVEAALKSSDKAIFELDSDILSLLDQVPDTMMWDSPIGTKTFAGAMFNMPLGGALGGVGVVSGGSGDISVGGGVALAGGGGVSVGGPAPGDGALVGGGGVSAGGNGALAEGVGGGGALVGGGGVSVGGGGALAGGGGVSARGDGVLTGRAEVSVGGGAPGGEGKLISDEGGRAATGGEKELVSVGGDQALDEGGETLGGVSGEQVTAGRGRAEGIKPETSGVPRSVAESMERAFRHKDVLGVEGLGNIVVEKSCTIPPHYRISKDGFSLVPRDEPRDGKKKKPRGARGRIFGRGVKLGVIRGNTEGEREVRRGGDAREVEGGIEVTARSEEAKLKGNDSGDGIKEECTVVPLERRKLRVSARIASSKTPPPVVLHESSPPRVLEKKAPARAGLRKSPRITSPPPVEEKMAADYTAPSSKSPPPSSQTKTPPPATASSTADISPMKATPLISLPRKTIPPATSPRKATPPATSPKKTRSPITSPRKATPPALSPKKTTPPAISPKKTTSPVTSPKKTTPPVTPPKTTTSPITSPKKVTPPAPVRASTRKTPPPNQRLETPPPSKSMKGREKDADATSQVRRSLRSRPVLESSPEPRDASLTKRPRLPSCPESDEVLLKRPRVDKSKASTKPPRRSGRSKEATTSGTRDIKTDTRDQTPDTTSEGAHDEGSEAATIDSLKDTSAQPMQVSLIPETTSEGAHDEGSDAATKDSLEVSEDKPTPLVEVGDAPETTSEGAHDDGSEATTDGSEVKKSGAAARPVRASTRKTSSSSKPSGDSKPAKEEKGKVKLGKGKGKEGKGKAVKEEEREELFGSDDNAIPVPKRAKQDGTGTADDKPMPIRSTYSTRRQTKVGQEAAAKEMKKDSLAEKGAEPDDGDTSSPTSLSETELKADEPRSRKGSKASKGIKADDKATKADDEVAKGLKADGKASKADKAAKGLVVDDKAGKGLKPADKTSAVRKKEAAAGDKGASRGKRVTKGAERVGEEGSGGDKPSLSVPVDPECPTSLPPSSEQQPGPPPADNAGVSDLSGNPEATVASGSAAELPSDGVEGGVATGGAESKENEDAMALFDEIINSGKPPPILPTETGMSTVEVLKICNYNLKASLVVDGPNLHQAVMTLRDLQELHFCTDDLEQVPDIVQTLNKVRRYGADAKIAKKAKEVFIRMKAMYLCPHVAPPPAPRRIKTTPIMMDYINQQANRKSARQLQAGTAPSTSAASTSQSADTAHEGTPTQLVPTPEKARTTGTVRMKNVGSTETPRSEGSRFSSRIRTSVAAANSDSESTSELGKEDQAVP